MMRFIRLYQRCELFHYKSTAIFSGLLELLEAKPAQQLLLFIIQRWRDDDFCSSD